MYYSNLFVLINTSTAFIFGNKTSVENQYFQNLKQLAMYAKGFSGRNAVCGKIASFMTSECFN